MVSFFYKYKGELNEKNKKFFIHNIEDKYEQIMTLSETN